MSIQIPGIDIDVGLDLYDDDEDIYLQVLKSYSNNTPEVLNKIREVSKESLTEYARVIHGIKGTSANLGAETLKEKAKQLEILAKAGDLEGVLALNEDFLKTADRLMADIKSWLEKNYDNK